MEDEATRGRTDPVPSGLQTIVVPLDGSSLANRALDIAQRLGDRTGAMVRPLTVRAPRAGPELPRGVPADTEVIVASDTADAIVGVIDEPETLLVMATHGRGRVGQMVLGSVAEAVLRNYSRPLLLVGPAIVEKATIEKIMVCVDGSALSEASLPVAERWSRDLNVPLEVIQVIRGDSGDQLAKAGVPLGDVDESAYVRRLAEGIGRNTSWEVLHNDNPVEGILSHATPNTLLALATHGRSGAQRLVMGSVAMRLAHRSAHPMLVLRPAAIYGNSPGGGKTQLP